MTPYRAQMISAILPAQEAAPDGRDVQAHKPTETERKTGHGQPQRGRDRAGRSRLKTNTSQLNVFKELKG